MIVVDSVAKRFAAPRRALVRRAPAELATAARTAAPDGVAAFSGGGAASSRHGEVPPGASGHFAGAVDSSGFVHAVRDVSFTAADGRITGLLGPNGAGKTTTLRMLAGLIVADAGRISVDGIDVTARPRAAQARMGVLSDARGLYPRLSARENIVYYGALQGMTRDAAEARATALAETLDMKPLLERRTEGFSQGERMKTALARALVHDPPNIVLDEPTNGLDVVATRALRETLRWLRAPAGGAKCIVFSTHIMQEVERLCDSVYIVADGRSVASGSVAELLARTGQRDFEEAFVHLAYPDVAGAAAPGADRRERRGRQDWDDGQDGHDGHSAPDGRDCQGGHRDHNDQDDHGGQASRNLPGVYDRRDERSGHGIDDGQDRRDRRDRRDGQDGQDGQSAQDRHDRHGGGAR